MHKQRAQLPGKYNAYSKTEKKNAAVAAIGRGRNNFGVETTVLALT